MTGPWQPPTEPRLVRRVLPPQEGAPGEPWGNEVWLTADGDFLFIGPDVTEEMHDRLPDDAGCRPTERMVAIDRATMLAALAHAEGSEHSDRSTPS